MPTLGQALLNFMTKWSGKSGGLILINVLKKMHVTNVDKMDEKTRFELLDLLSRDYLSTFLGQSRFLMARSELLSILGLPHDSYQIMPNHHNKIRSPNLFGKPKV